jgi:FkbM family methyltransferase
MAKGSNRKVAFVLASSDHGAMIVNRFDYHMVDADRGFGVGFDLLNTSAFDPAGVELTTSLLNLRRRHFGDGVTAIDCGANIGVFTLECARAMTGWGNVIAIEAQERVFYALAGNIAINNAFNARAIFAAASDQSGMMKAPQLDHTRPASFGSVEIKRREHTEFAGQTIDYDAPGAVEIPCMTLDSLGLSRVDLVKIDVEGMEMNVLAGATALIGKHRPAMVVEYVKSDAEKLRQWLAALDYRVLVSGINLVAIHNGDPGLASIQVKA